MHDATDADFKRASVWIGDYEVVKWDMESEKFVWDDAAISSSGIMIDKDEAEERVKRG